MSMADLIASVANARDSDNGTVFVTGADSDHANAHTNLGNESIFQTKTGASAVIKAFQQNPSMKVHKKKDSYGLTGFLGTYHAHDIELADSSRSSSGDSSPHEGAGGFVVHRQDTVHMEYESATSSNKGLSIARVPPSYGGGKSSQQWRDDGAKAHAVMGIGGK